MKDWNAPQGWADTLPSQFGSLAGEIAPAAVRGSTGAEIEVPLDGEDAPGRAVTSPSSTPWTLWRWMLEGLRAGVFLRPRLAPASPGPWKVLFLVVAAALIELAWGRLQVPGPARFELAGWLTPWWSSLVLLWLAWWGMDGRSARSPQAVHAGLAGWFVLSTWAAMVPVVLAFALMAWSVHQPEFWSQGYAPQVFWVAYGLLVLWMLGVIVVLGARFMASRWRWLVWGVGVVSVVALSVWLSPPQPWQPTMDTSAAGDLPPRIELSQATFENQQALWVDQTHALAPQRPGVVDVYGLVFAPYASENVFRRESTMVADLLRERFDAKGRVLHLLNHGETSDTHIWATPENLQRAVAALAERMDREHDVLVVYLTSHGAGNHELSADHWPLNVSPIAPEMLRAALDQAGVRNRVVAISACYSGGWVEPLANDTTLVMTAADATHTSYGCGAKSELTFFGRAVFDEQLRKTYSFTEAFERAVPVIAQREVEAGKADGFSNPQIRVGPAIEPVLDALVQRLKHRTNVVTQAPLFEAGAH